MSEVVEIPIERLSPEALDGVIDDFILREGTDYGHHEHGFEEKRAEVRRQLANGEARIVFDAKLESVTLILRASLRP